MARKKAEAKTETMERIGVVDAEKGLNIREKADIKSRVLTVLKDGEKVVITGENGDWYQTETGYAMKKFIRIDE